MSVRLSVLPDDEDDKKAASSMIEQPIHIWPASDFSTRGNIYLLELSHPRLPVGIVIVVEHF